MMRVAIVGGGPGGLFSALNLEEYCSDLCSATLFEAGPRLGGKVLTKSFTKAPVLYEAGVAELYSYAHFGPDPLRTLVKKLGLSTVRMNGPAVILGDAILRDRRDIVRHFGAATAEAIDNFQDQCKRYCSVEDYYEGHWQDDNEHPWGKMTFAEALDEIPDEIARKYIEIAARSDVATESHLTTALNGLKNVLMDDPRYLRLYSIEGGIERLIDRIKARLTSEIRLNSAVVRVSKNADETYRLRVRANGQFEEHDFDAVILSLPNYWLQRLEWGSRELRQAMTEHLAHYDHPAHYLRVTCLFEQPFWREHIPGSYFMSDAFGGVCMYDEGARHPAGDYGVLGWLIAGNDAMSLSNLSDDRLIEMVLDSLPAPLAHGKKLFLEANVQRWVGTINGIPGGNPVQEIKRRHQPDSAGHPGLMLVGDYLFDSTINGVCDSADFVNDLLLTRMRKLKYAKPAAVNGNGQAARNPAVIEHFSKPYVDAMIQAAFGWKRPYTLLETPDKRLDLRKLPFEDESFDFVDAAGLVDVPEKDIDRAIRELYRVAKIGVYFSGVTSDMSRDAIETHNLLSGVRTLASLWEWSELFLSHGFRITMADETSLEAVWKIEQAAAAGTPWYSDADSLRSCFYSKPNVPAKERRAPAPRLKMKGAK